MCQLFKKNERRNFDLLLFFFSFLILFIFGFPTTIKLAICVCTCIGCILRLLMVACVDHGILYYGYFILFVYSLFDFMVRYSASIFILFLNSCSFYFSFSLLCSVLSEVNGIILFRFSQLILTMIITIKIKTMSVF